MVDLFNRTLGHAHEPFTAATAKAAYDEYVKRAFDTSLLGSKLTFEASPRCAHTQKKN